MTVTIRPLPTPEDRARTFRAMARERHAQAVDRLLARDIEGWSAMRRDVDALEEQARLEEDRALRVRMQQRERALEVRAIEGILAIAEADHAG